MSAGETVAVAVLEFSAADTTRLDELEARIGAVGPAVVGAGGALREIRDERLYRLRGWTTFDDYCREMWDLRRETADRMIRSADVAGVLESAGKSLPRSERALRVLAPLLGAPDELIEVFERAEAEAVAGRGRVTSALLERMLHPAGTVVVDADVDAPAGAVVDLAPADAADAGSVDTDWDAIIRGAIGGSGGSGSGGGAGGSDKELTDAQRMSRMIRAFGQIAAVSVRLQDMVRELGAESVETEEVRAGELNAAAGTASAAFEEACEAVQGWYSGDDVGLPVPEVTEDDFPTPFKYE